MRNGRNEFLGFPKKENHQLDCPLKNQVIPFLIPCLSHKPEKVTPNGLLIPWYTPSPSG